jgi:hypothetical protein
MRLGKVLATALVGGSLLAAPIGAQAADAKRLSSDVQGENLRGGFIIPVIAIIAVILGILALTSDDDDSLPHSP